MRRSPRLERSIESRRRELDDAELAGATLAHANARPLDDPQGAANLVGRQRFEEQFRGGLEVRSILPIEAEDDEARTASRRVAPHIAEVEVKRHEDAVLGGTDGREALV